MNQKHGSHWIRVEISSIKLMQRKNINIIIYTLRSSVATVATKAPDLPFNSFELECHFINMDNWTC